MISIPYLKGKIVSPFNRRRFRNRGLRLQQRNITIYIVCKDLQFRLGSVIRSCNELTGSLNYVVVRKYQPIASQ